MSRLITVAEVVVGSDVDGCPVPGMDVDVFFPVPDAEAFEAAAREWLGWLPALLAPAEWEEVLRCDKPPFSGKPTSLWPEYDDWAEPFMAWGDILVTPLKWNGMRTQVRRFTRASRFAGWMPTARDCPAACRFMRLPGWDCRVS